MPEVGKNIEPPTWHDRDCPCVHPLDTRGCTCEPKDDPNSSGSLTKRQEER
jgi:hypothetical protein